MGSEIFSLKSLYLEDTVVRGARVSTKNATSTRSIEVNPGDDPIVRTGETGVNKEYLIQSSLVGNDLNGYGTFIQNSDVIRGYTGAQNLSHSDKVKLDSDKTSYTVTGINGTDVYIIEKYTKENSSDPDVLSGSCSIEKVSLDSVKYERSDTNIVYDKDNSQWGVTGVLVLDPTIAPSDSFEFDKGITLKFQKGTSSKKPDIATVLSTSKTLVSNNTSTIFDVSLSPIPYPHSSLQVFLGKNGEELKKAVEAEDYFVNYTNSSEVLYPIPPYEERKVAYIKFLDSMIDEVQVKSIDATFSGNMTIDKETIEGDTVVVRPVQDILSTDDFSIKVAGSEKIKNTDYVSNDGAGMLTFVEHRNHEALIDTLTYSKKLLWDGISVITGVKEEDVNDFNNLVIPGVSGLKDIDYTVYYEDTDSNNLIRDTDFTIDPESGAFSLSAPTNSDGTVLVSYFVEGDDIKDEKVELNTLRLNSFPLIANSLVLTEKYNKLDNSGSQVTLTRVLVEGIDFNVSYVTGYIELLPSDEITVELKASYTPMAQINCIVRSIAKSMNYTYTIIDDVFTFSQDDIGSKRLIFKVNNPVVSIPQKILFDSDKTISNYNFTGSITPENILSIGIKGTDKTFIVSDSSYDDIKKIITLDSSVNTLAPLNSDIVVGSYTYESDILPYAPVLLISTVINAGDDSFLIEGYDKTDSLKAGNILQVENKDPQSINYYMLRNVSYNNQSTKVDIYGTFPETAIDPVFSILDEQITWQTMSEDVTVDTTVPVDSEYIILDGGPLFLNTNIKKEGLLLVNSQDIYTITLITTQDSRTTINIYPNLRSSLTSDIKFSILPVYLAGITTLPARKLILNDVEQPAFTLWYNSPKGYEGSAKLLFVGDALVFDEYVSGVKNPESYRFLINDYSDIDTLAKAIQATKSTFRINVSYMDVPDYNPFTIAHADKEDYYLGSGIWSPSTLIPFENEEYTNLPYTFKVTPELFKYTLLELFSGKNEFTIKDADLSKYFTSDMIISFINKVNGRVFFSKVLSAEYLSEKDTLVTLSSTIPENMIAPYKYVSTSLEWLNLSSNMIGVDYDTSQITFQGKLTDNVREGTLLSIGDSYIYQVQKVTQNVDNFEISLNAYIDSEVKVQTYFGYIKISSVPVVLNTPGPQPVVQYTYTTPYRHTGYAAVKISVDKIDFKEVIDNFNIKETSIVYSGYDNFGLLFEDIKKIESYVPGNNPFNVLLDNSYKDVLSDTFDKYALKSTMGQYTSLPSYTPIAVGAFDISYTVPSGYAGTFSVRVTSEYLSIKEHTIDLYGNELEKETSIQYVSTKDMKDLVTSIIPNITSVISDTLFPFTTTLKNQDTFGLGGWGYTHLTTMIEEYLSGNQTIYATVDVSSFIAIGDLNERKLELATEYAINNGVIELVTPVAPLDRYSLNYMGLDNLYENEGDSITCSCRFITALPVGYRLDVYLEYQNIDQFYIQKLTERKFSEIVTVPQIEQLIEQKALVSGQGNDSGATNDSTPNYEGGVADINYYLQDEYIKKQLYLRFFKWYKQRLRGLSAEIQLGLGFKFGHSNAVGEVEGYYSLEDQYVETEDYTLTKDEDIAQIANGFSKYFPIGYSDQAPDYYHRFSKEYLSFNEVYCCNVKYKDDKNKEVTVGVIKSDQPYWNRATDLTFMIWKDDTKNLVDGYVVDVPVEERSFAPSNYTFLRVINVGDKVKVDGFKNSYTISSIETPADKTYEYIITSKPFTDKGIKTYSIVDKNVQISEDPDEYKLLSLDTFVEALSSDGYRILITRQDKEEFPMFDDYGSLGATAYGDAVERLPNNTRRIKKPFGAALLKLFFPFIKESTKNFKVLIKRDSEATSWETLGMVDLSKLTFKEERNIDDVLDALRYDFTEKYTIPMPTPAPSIVIYDIKEDANKGFFRYFYLSLENIYDAESKDGYYQGIVIRAKDRNWSFKFVDGGEEDIIEDYGYSAEKVYENFYDPENIYKRLLLEKQAWQTEELIIRDLYDYNDKIARAFDNGDLNRKNSIYQDYLAMPDGGTDQGISDILRAQILTYEKQLRFLVDTAGPVFRTLYPDLIHAEDSASPEITTTYTQTLYAWNLYNASYAKMVFYNNLNENNNYTWKNSYIRWVMSIEQGILYQGLLKQMYDSNSGVVIVGLTEVPTIDISLGSQLVYNIVNPVLMVSSTYDGKYIKISFDISRKDDPGQITTGIVWIIYLYDKVDIGGIPTISYKDISKVCSEISDYEYEGVKLFLANNVFTHNENDVVSKTVLVDNAVIESVKGYQLVSTNVADHRASDPRILFLSKKIEDRVYTHEIRELPGVNISYLGNYYLLKYGTPGLSITLIYQYDRSNFRHGIFYNNAGEKVLTLAYDTNGETVYTTYQLYVTSSTSIVYKTLSELSNELNSSSIFTSIVSTSNSSRTCDSFIITTDYVSAVDSVATPYISTNSAYSSVDKETDQFYYRIYTDSSKIRKLDIVFYTIILDGKKLYSGTTISDTFTFSFQKTDGSFKTLSEICQELNNFTYLGEKLLSASSVYEADPKSGLTSAYIIADDILTAVGYDWVTTLYVDTYVEAISGKDSNSRTVSSIENAVFSYPMYTANGNSNKAAIEDIPVSGNWEASSSSDVIEVSCIDGFEWSISFLDYNSGDYKSYMTPQDILDLINNNESITEDQYNQIATVEDRPAVGVLKELVLTKIDGSEENIARFNLRKYGTISELVEAIVLTRFNTAGEVDTNGIRAFFTATLIGDLEVEGKYRSSELKTEYTPIIKSFNVTMNDGSIVYKYNQLIGWQLMSTTLTGTQKQRLKMMEERYSYGETHKFVLGDPETAYNDTLNKNPQGFRRDILAFDIYSWDYNAQYEIKDNWLYLKSSSVDYLRASDYGQPDKTLGYGIPLAGSGHAMAPDKESIGDLINRVNNDNIINKWFYLNLKFTRDDNINPGYFEYNYLPNLYAQISRSTLDNIMLKDDNVFQIKPASGYTFTASNITVDDDADTLDVSCDWSLTYEYERTFFFNETNSRTIDGLTNSINAALAPEIATSLIEAVLDPDSHGLSGSMSKNLLPTYFDRSVSMTGTNLRMYVGTSTYTAIKIKIRNVSGSNYTLSNATYVIPKTRDRITIKCEIVYRNTYTLSSYSLAGISLEYLANFLKSIKPYPDSIFTPLFDCSVLSNSYNDYTSDRLLSISSSIVIGWTKLTARLHDIVAFNVMNMTSEGTINVSDSTIEVITSKTYTRALSNSTDLYAFIDTIKGNYFTGFLSCDVLPLKISSVDTGKLNPSEYSLASGNTPAHVYFGILGDVKFIQISDHNLHTQYNYIKERLGMPWKDSQGNLDYDYYTPENYNENNPTAIDLSNFLGYLRTERYNQIKNSVINESIVSNKYLWLYLKFHKEFGCDQRANTLKDAIEKGNSDIETLGQVL
jgi:hypothetical protein